jgi:histidine triad (HIT) family protein
MSPTDCLFCRIARREIAALVVDEDETTVTFLDHRPVFPGHCLIVPREHYGTMMDLPAPALASVFGKAQRIARAIETGLSTDGTFVAVNNKVSQSVPHVHVHVVPRRKKDGLRGFFWPRHKYASDEEAQRILQSIRGALGGGG